MLLIILRCLSNEQELRNFKMQNTGEIIIYQAEDNQVQIEVHIEEDTVWLTQEQMSHLFDKDKTVITRHINSIFNEGELDEKSNVQKMQFPFRKLTIRKFRTIQTNSLAMP
jgi:hypothetical protein